MATIVTLPQLGETVAEGTILKWLKHEGDRVEKDELLFEISTDKVDSEVPSPVGGTISRILIEEGATAKVGTPIAEISDSGSAVAEAPAKAAAPQLEQPATPPSSAAETGQPAPDVAAAQAAEPPNHEPALAVAGALPVSPLVKRLAKQHGVDLSQIQGSGEGGRVTKNDLLAYVEARSQAQPQPQAQPVAEARQPQPPAQPQVTRQVSTPGYKPAEAPKAQAGEEIVEVSRHRRMIAEHMMNSRQTHAHVTAVVEVDMTNIENVRNAHKDDFKKAEGFSLTYLPFVARAAVEALQHFPLVNATLADADHLVMRRYVNLGIAVALEQSNDLIVPVVKGADERNLLGMARAIYDLAIRARGQLLSPDEVTGGTFTITNPGVYGSVLGAPIIPMNQAGILSLEAVEKRVVVVDGAIAIRSMVYLPLSYDHRILDGMLAAKFLKRLKDNLESWDFAEELS